MSEPACEHVDVLIVGAGISGIGAGHHLGVNCPRQDLHDPRGQGIDRRHLGPVPVSGNSLGLRYAHPRLLVPALGRVGGARRRTVDPRLRASDGRGGSEQTKRSASITVSSAPHGRPRRPGGWLRRNVLIPERPCASAAASFSCARATTATTRVTRRTSREFIASVAPSSTRSTGPRTSTMPARERL